jgi:Domain of unknown function (DUF5659)
MKNILFNRKSQSDDLQDEFDPAQVFTTHDIGVSTALLCCGYELLLVDKQNPRKALFVFKKEQQIEGYTDSYFSDRLEVKARSYFDHLKALKNMLYSDTSY